MKFKLVTLLTIISIIIGYAFKKISWIIDSKLAESIINKDDSFKLTPDNVSQFLFSFPAVVALFRSYVFGF